MKTHERYRLASEAKFTSAANKGYLFLAGRADDIIVLLRN
jgi:hypothetical protein